MSFRCPRTLIQEQSTVGKIRIRLIRGDVVAGTKENRSKVMD
jgi:hypothetical protein